MKTDALLGFISKIDIFGAEVGLKYEGKSKYTSRLGGFATIIVGGLLCALLYQQFYQIFGRLNPNLIYEQTYVQIPSRYSLSKDQFNFMIGLQDQDGNAYLDEDIFTVEAYFEYKEQTNQNGKVVSNFIVNQIPTGPCSEDDFQMIDTKQYFLNQPYQKQYCIKGNNDLYLEGQFDQDKFSVLIFKIIECTDKPNCKPANLRQEILKTSNAQIYYIDRNVQTQNFEKPFKSVGKTQFYNIFYDYLLKSNFIFSNTHVQDDIGYFAENYQTQTQLQFVTDRYQLQSKTTNEFFNISLFLDKNKENNYFRTYQKITGALSQLGGTFQVLFFFGCLFIKPYNLLKLQNRLHKDIFSQENQSLNKKESNQKEKKKRSSIFNKKSSMKVSNAHNYLQDAKNEKKEENQFQIEDEDENESSYLRKIKQFFGFVSQNVKQQMQEIENMKSIKTIMNTQIQFILLKNLFYQIDFSNIKQNKDLSQTFDSKSKIQGDGRQRENSIFNSFNFNKLQKDQSIINLKAFNSSKFNLNDFTPQSPQSPSRFQDESKYFSQIDSPKLQESCSQKNEDQIINTSNDKNILSQNEEQKQENSKSDIEIDNQIDCVKKIDNYIQNFNLIQSKNCNSVALKKNSSNCQDESYQDQKQDN
ncbi:transmembrane protein, putative (macronuclear) [Tetrahymena thermophila SB210]|uniref:Transmembrane protein, putative n=1 Tax=Tetrahymena thermophila (strain SB210) TaxID=312017 RepID=I7M940_TETTS|nr:transmembrane protein, putative [Tetrahymena thermophila SB210]EAS00658.1 transmembrane protein, putative [Tetrahymena thermophila SB210]|eukprot:XP_001020903.1 transmembrane protein, putative [Tetrahymena thermophila SB210]